MLKKKYPYYLANRPENPNHDLAVTDKYTGKVATRVALADNEAIDRAIGAAEAAAGNMKGLAPYERQKILYHCVERFSERAEELALALCIEAGKPIRDSRGEVTRDRKSVGEGKRVDLGGRRSIKKKKQRKHTT